MSTPPPRKQGLIRSGANFLVLSVVVHLLFGVVATYLIVQTIQAKRKQTFAGAPQSPNAPTRAIEHKVQMQKKQQTMSAPAVTKRITTTSNARVALPAMPAMPKMDSAITPLAMAGMGGTGMGLGISGSSGGGGGGGKLSFFGLHTSAGGLAGTFYDLKQTNNRQPTPIAKGGIDGEGVHLYNVLVQRFVRGGWNTDLFTSYFRSATVLYTSWIYVPNDVSGEAAKAFNVADQVQGDRWVVLYKGRVKAPKEGTFRFVGRGDNVLIARLDTRLVFDGSQPVLIPEAVAANAVGPGGGPGWQMAAGPWFDLSQGQEMDIQIIIGDTGGLFSDSCSSKRRARSTPCVGMHRSTPPTRCSKPTRVLRLPTSKTRPMV